MTNILEDYSQDIEVCSVVSTVTMCGEYRSYRHQAIECMMSWPLIQRNKVDDSKVAVPVEACAASDNEVLASAAKKVCHAAHFIVFLVLNGASFL